MPTPLQKRLQEKSVDVQALSQSGISLERCRHLLDGAEPNIDEIRAIARALNLQSRSLIVDAPDLGDAEQKLRRNYRSKDFVDAVEDLELLRQSQELTDLLPKRRHQRYRFDLGIDDRNLDTAELLAQICRAEIFEYDLSNPLFALERLVSVYTSAYVIVSKLRNIEGCAIEISGGDYIFIAERGDARMRFTLAHELCHYLVDLRGDGGWFDENPEISSGNEKDAERFANAFAGALLLPAEATATALSTFRKFYGIVGDHISDIEMVFLSRFFGVNFQVAARRCEDLQILPRGAANSLYQSVIQRYRSPEKLAELAELPPREVYKWGFGRDFAVNQVKAAVMSGEVSIGRLSEALQMSLAEVAKKLAADADLY